MTRLNKTVSALQHLLPEKHTYHTRVLCMGMRGAGKTTLRRHAFAAFGEERGGSVADPSTAAAAFPEVDARRAKADGMPVTSLVMQQRPYVDIAYKRIEPEEYEWEDRRVKVHLLEPDSDFRMEKEVSRFLELVDCIAVFVDCSSSQIDDYDLNIWMPFLKRLPSVPPLVIVYNSKGSPAANKKERVRHYINYDSLVMRLTHQVLEVEVTDLSSQDDVTAVINACLRQGTLRTVLALPKPNTRLVPQPDPSADGA